MMGGGDKTTTTQHGTSTTNPWEDAIPGLQGILSQASGMLPNTGATAKQSGLLDQLSLNAQGGNPFAGQINDVTSGLLSGGADYSGRATGAFDTLNKNLAPTIRGDYLDPNTNPFFAKTTSTIADDTTNRINSMYAASGRDASGAGGFAKTLGEGIARGTAPVYADAYNRERGNQLGAMSTLYSGDNATTGLLSGLQQTRFGNQEAGANMALGATGLRDQSVMQQLAIEAERRGIPLQNLGALSSLITPIAGLGGQSMSDSTGTSIKKSDPTKAIIGGLIGGAGLLSNMGGMKGMSGLLGDSSGNPGSLLYGSNPFTPSGARNPAYG